MPGRRPLFAFAALFAVVLPACLHVSVPADPPAKAPTKTPVEDKVTARAVDPPQPPRIYFGELQSARPGTVVTTKPTNPATPTNTNTNTAQRPTPPAPGGPAQTGGTEPGAFPALPAAPG